MTPVAVPSSPKTRPEMALRGDAKRKKEGEKQNTSQAAAIHTSTVVPHSCLKMEKEAGV